MSREFSDVLDTKIERSVSRFLDGVESAQSGMFNKVLALIKELELNPSGSIRSNTKNLAILNRVRTELQKTILTDSYIAKVGNFSNQFEAVKTLNDSYLGTLSTAFNPNRLAYKDALKVSVQLTRDSLLESGISERVINPAKKIITDAITGKWTYSDLVDNLRTTIKGDPETLGGLERYTKQIATDSLNQFSANYTQTVSEDLGFEWYFYSGGKRSTSRPFCKQYAGKYFHKKEIEDFGKGKDIDGGRLTSTQKQGWIKGTNSSNIFTYRSGWNCGHQYVPVGLGQVPKSVVKRNIEKGYYQPD